MRCWILLPIGSDLSTLIDMRDSGGGLRILRLYGELVAGYVGYATYGVFFSCPTPSQKVFVLVNEG